MCSRVSIWCPSGTLPPWHAGIFLSTPLIRSLLRKLKFMPSLEKREAADKLVEIAGILTLNDERTINNQLYSLLFLFFFAQVLYLLIDTQTETIYVDSVP